MTSQIFKKKYSTESLFEFLESICMKNDKQYVFNTNSYKKGLFNDAIQIFITGLKEYYHLSKQIYLERKMSYNNFTTILRQICKYNQIAYTSQIKYDKSEYEIVYYIVY